MLIAVDALVPDDENAERFREWINMLRDKRSWLIASSLIVLTNAMSAQAAIVFTTDFESGIPTEFSGPGFLDGVQGYAGLGTGANVFGGVFLRNIAGNGVSNGATLTLSGLPAHTSVDIAFLLAVIDSWDGTGNPTHGPDGLTVSVDGSTVFSEIFENSFSGVQSYVPPAGVELARHAELGFRPTGAYFYESAYDMGLDPTFSNIAHTSNTLTISWFRSSGLQINSPSFVDESWALENVSVALNGTAASHTPEPSTAAIWSILGLVGAGVQRRRRHRAG